MTPELTILAYSVALLIIHLLIQASASDFSKGIGWALGARDENRKPSVLAARLERSLRNYLETFPAFVALALALAIADRSTGTSVLGAQIWIAARVLYLAFCAAGIPYLRSAAWITSMLGLVAMLLPLL